MPMLRNSFRNRKNSTDYETNQLSKSQSSLILPTAMAQGSGLEFPVFTRTGLMVTQAEHNSNRSNERKNQVGNKLKDSKKMSPRLDIIREQVSDLGYLKNVKSKVNCWKEKGTRVDSRHSMGPDLAEKSILHHHKLFMSPQKSPKAVEVSNLNATLKDSSFSKSQIINFKKVKNT